jgi:hypothetical protein
LRKQIDAEILGIKLKLSERSTQEVYDLTEFTLSLGNMTAISGMKVTTIMLNQSLNYWIDKQFFGWFYRWKLSVKKLSKGLSPKEITELAEKVMKLDGNEVKKKVVAESL